MKRRFYYRTPEGTPNVVILSGKDEDAIREYIKVHYDRSIIWISLEKVTPITRGGAR